MFAANLFNSSIYVNKNNGEIWHCFFRFYNHFFRENQQKSPSTKNFEKPTTVKLKTVCVDHPVQRHSHSRKQALFTHLHFNSSQRKSARCWLMERIKFIAEISGKNKNVCTEIRLAIYIDAYESPRSIQFDPKRRNASKSMKSKWESNWKQITVYWVLTADRVYKLTTTDIYTDLHNILLSWRTMRNPQCECYNHL